MGKKQANSSKDSSKSKRFGEIAIERNYASKDSINQALRDQKKLEELGLPQKVGEILKKRDLLTEEQIQDIITEQKGKTRKLGNFEIMEKIGHGAMGVVFRARQISMNRIVALKILAPKYANDKTFIDRFVEEARAAGAFSHENIVTAIDVGYEKPYHYLVMDHVDGSNLRTLVEKNGKFEEKDALRIALDVARALEHALQKKNVIHRDVKPENVMLTSRNVAKLLDMGLVCTTRSEEDATESRTGEEKKAVGTPHYMSPEAARGESDLDTRADIYSLGCTLYHLLTADRPYPGKNGRKIMLQHLTEKFPDAREKVPELSESTLRILAKMTAKERNDRYDSPTQLIEDLAAAVAGKTPLHVQSKESRRFKRTRSKNTTGPRAPIGTTGPRVPIGARGTTGPRIGIGPRTTGPVVPVDGDREVGAARPPRKQKNAATGWIAAAFAAVVIGVFAVAAGSRSPTTPPKKKTSQQAIKETATRKTPRITPKPTASARSATKPDMAKERQAAAEAALAAAKTMLEKEPLDFPAILTAFDDARSKCAGTTLVEAWKEAVASAHGIWAKAFDKAVGEIVARGMKAVESGDFRAVQAAIHESAVPDHLRAADWRSRYQSACQPIRDACEKKAQSQLAEAAKLAAAGNVKGMESAIALARQSGSIPVTLAPSSARARQHIAEWERKLIELKKAEQAALLARREKARAIALRAWRELLPTLKRNRFNDAIEQLDTKYRKEAGEGATEWVDRDIKDIKTVVGLREATIERLKKLVGEKVSLKKGPIDLKGKVAASSSSKGVTLKLSGGPEMTIGANELGAADVDRYTPASGGKDKAEGLRQRALLFLCAGEIEKAKGLFVQARDAGLGDAIKPYLERIEMLMLGEAEILARKAWEDLQGVLKSKKWKEIIAAIKAYQERHGNTAFAKKQAAKLSELLAEAQSHLIEVPLKELDLWLKPESGLKGSDQKIASWSDQSGRKHDARQENQDQQPLLIADAVNGLPALKFDGRNDNLVVPGVQGRMDNFTLVWVLHPVSRRNWSQSIGGNRFWGEFNFHTTTGGAVYVGPNARTRITPGDGPGNNTVVLNTWQLFMYSCDNGMCRLFKNGRQLAQKKLPIATWTGFRLGNTDGNTLHGMLAEVLIYRRALPDKERQALEKYLLKKYAIGK